MIHSATGTDAIVEVTYNRDSVSNVSDVYQELTMFLNLERR